MKKFSALFVFTFKKQSDFYFTASFLLCYNYYIMINLDQEQRLGEKALLFLIIKRTRFSYFFLLIGLIILFVRSLIISAVVDGMGTLGSVSASAPLGVSNVITSIILILLFIAILIFVIGFIVGWLEYKNYTFSLGEFDLIMKKGIFDRKETSIPYHQIDSVDIERNVMYQLLGLSRLVMITAAHEEADEKEMAEIVLEPIEKNFAEEIRAMLERKVGVQVVKNEADADKENHSL